MAGEQKPYRVYRGGRVKGKVPPPARPARSARGDGDGRVDYAGPGARQRRPRWGRRIGVAILLLLVLLIVWAVASYLAVRNGVTAANDRLDGRAQAALAEQDGMLLSTPTTILLAGTDNARYGGRSDAKRADSLMLVRTDPDVGRFSFLSFPRDLRVPIPGYGDGKINSAYQLGGAQLALRTVRDFTGVPINHVIVVNFGEFEEVIDALGGVEIDVPRPILSNRFDCPYPTQERCSRWEGWRFGKGRQTMSGRRALIYSRVRANRLDPNDTDVSRAERQQRVIEAIGDEITSIGTIARLPLLGDELVSPLATDLSANELLQLGWRRFRADSSEGLHCRLGGYPQTLSGQSVIVPDEERVNILLMFQGRSAPQPPALDNPRYGSGCAVGTSALGRQG